MPCSRQVHPDYRDGRSEALAASQRKRLDCFGQIEPEIPLAGV